MTKSNFTEQYELFRQLLIRERHDASLTQSYVAKALDKPQSYVAKYENGERRLDVIEFLNIANVIGFDVVTFLNTLRK